VFGVIFSDFDTDNGEVKVKPFTRIGYRSQNLFQQ